MTMFRPANVTVIVSIAILLAACGGSAEPVRVVAVTAQGTAVAAALEGAASTMTDGPLLLEVVNADRTVQPGADEVFDFKMVNATGQPLSVVVALEHADGQRWRTSLCVDKQCLLGDGSEPSVTDPVILPPFLEQAFQAHVFVDAGARSGQQTVLTLRVEPLAEAALPRSVSLTANVGQP